MTMIGNGSAKKKMPMNGRAGDAEQHRRFQGALADADQRLDHDDKDRGLDAEQRAVDHRDAAAERVEQAQAQHHQRARQDEQNARGEPAADAMQQPADIGRELLRLRPWRQHAEAERMQEARLVDPLLLVDQNAVHRGDLSGRAAERQAADLEPDFQRLVKGRRGGLSRGGLFHCRHDRFTLSLAAALAGQL